LSTISARGGGDAPEDIAGAFEKALEQEWSSKTRYAVLITDAPCHGNKYHVEKTRDDYPAGDPNGLVMED
jgi:hypothetical protein